MTAKPLNPLVKFVLEMGPLVAFFLANGRFGIFIGTGVFMAATVIALGVSYAVSRTIPLLPLVTAVFVMVFGGLTIVLANDVFIKLKPTIMDLCIAAALLIGLKTNRLYIKLLLETAIQLTERGWLLLTRAWIGFFVLLATLNELVWRTTPTDTWVKFKVFGVMPLTVLFSLSLVPVILKHTIPEETAKAPGNEP